MTMGNKNVAICIATPSRTFGMLDFFLKSSSHKTRVELSQRGGVPETVYQYECYDNEPISAMVSILANRLQVDPCKIIVFPCIARYFITIYGVFPFLKCLH